MNEQAISIIANYSVNTIEKNLNNLNADTLKEVLTWIKIPPRVFKALNEEQQAIFIEHNIYLHYNIGCMQNYLSSEIIKNQQLRNKVYGRLINQSLTEKSIHFLTSTPIDFMYYSNEHKEIWDKIDKNEYFGFAFATTINKAQQKEMVKHNINDLLSWMIKEDIDGKIIYDCLLNMNTYYGNFKYSKITNKVLKNIFIKVKDFITRSAFEWTYQWFYPIMTVEEEREMLCKVIDFNEETYEYNCHPFGPATINVNRLKYNAENQDVINKIKFMDKLSSWKG